MKRLLHLSAALLALLSFTATTQAQTIVSLQYQTNGSATVGALTAGIAPYNVTDWNVQGLSYVSGTGATDSSLITSTGADATGLSATVSSLGGYDSSNGNSFPAGGDHNLLSAYALTNYGSFVNTSLTLTLNGLNASDTYTLVAYVFDNDGTEASLTAGGTTLYYAGATNPLASYTQITSTTTGTPSLGDYATFTGLTGSTSQVLSLTPLGGSLLGLSGFQLIDTTVAAAPEPSTWALMLGGLAMLGFVLRRKSTARI